MDVRTELKNGMTIDEACKKYHVTFSELVDSLKNSESYYTTINYRYISKNNSRYIIQKSINNKSVIFGSYFDLEDAIEVRDQLIKLDWNVDKNDFLGDMYIVKTLKGGFRVVKGRGKYKNAHYGIYESLTDARKVRDCLVRVDWDMDYLPLILKRLGVVRIGS